MFSGIVAALGLGSTAAGAAGGAAAGTAAGAAAGATGAAAGTAAAAVPAAIATPATFGAAGSVGGAATGISAVPAVGGGAMSIPAVSTPAAGLAVGQAAPEAATLANMTHPGSVFADASGTIPSAGPAPKPSFSVTDIPPVGGGGSRPSQGLPDTPNAPPGKDSTYDAVGLTQLSQMMQMVPGLSALSGQKVAPPTVVFPESGPRGNIAYTPPSPVARKRESESRKFFTRGL